MSRFVSLLAFQRAAKRKQGTALATCEAPCCECGDDIGIHHLCTDCLTEGWGGCA